MLPGTSSWELGKDVALDGSASEEEANILLRVAFASVRQNVDGRNVDCAKVVDASNALGWVKGWSLSRSRSSLCRVDLGGSLERHRRDGRVPIPGWANRPGGANCIVGKLETHAVMRTQIGMMGRGGRPRRIRLFRRHVPAHRVHVKVLDANNLQVIVEELLIITRASCQFGGIDGCGAEAITHLPNRVRVRLQVDVKFCLGVVVKRGVAGSGAHGARSAGRVLKRTFNHEVTLFSGLSCLNRCVKSHFKRGGHWGCGNGRAHNVGAPMVV